MSNTTATTTSYRDNFETVLRNSRTLGSAQPAVMKAFAELHKAGAAAGVLDTKTRELMCLAISVVVRCDDCIAYHVHDALEAGATREEMADAIGVAILMGGGPSMIYATHAIEAVDQFLEHAS
jgi:AhpD family alkylhydroperoxidase